MAHYILFGPNLPGGVFTGELRLAARTLFDAGVAGLTDEETISMVDRWQHSRKVFSRLLRPVTVADSRQPYSTLFTSRLGKKVSHHLNGLAPLRVHCRWSIQTAFYKVFLLLFSNYECSDRTFTFVLKRSEYNIEVRHGVPS